MSTLVHSFDGRPLPKFDPSFVVLHHPSSYLYIDDRLDYWETDCSSEFVCVVMPGGCLLAGLLHSYVPSRRRIIQ